ncbi:MAG: ATPase subunit of ABC transporter with duplicated ATPase domains [Candidatus Poriferisodalaceae bacterium]|jgi:ATPase subunit of ABC transporter with duplicated ATPase domains
MGAGERTVRVLPAAGVFGANASGKSTILRAMGDMRERVLGSFRQGTASTVIQRKPFQLDSQSAEQPTRSEPPILLNPMTPATEF